MRETGVACKNTKADRVIVTISYELNGKNGDYGFDYEKDENGGICAQALWRRRELG